MCGICGVAGPVDRGVLALMTATMTHRGPDDVGLHVEDGVGLGVRRLSIIDLPGGHQPIANEDGGVRVVFNGEIYNHATLRERLARQGHRFRTQADTEVLVHLYEEYGVDGVHLLRGMFAYALWDRPRRRLVLVRDRLGIKPLYYAQTGGALLFASEAKALLRHPAIAAAADPGALDLYLALQYVPGERTLFRGIRKLRPGHVLVFEDGRAHVRRYWDVVYGEGERGIDLEDASAEFRELFAEAVRSHLVSDVPVGALLSGGMDSSAVVAEMARAGGTVRTFTVGFDVPSLRSELAEARLVARHLGTVHEEIVVKPDAAALLPRLVWHLDEPVADAAALPTYLLCAAARRAVAVVLTGEGGDELLGGYPRYAWFLVARRLRRLLPAGIRERLLLPLARQVLRTPRRREGLDKLLAERTDAARYLRWIANFDGEARRGIVSPALAAVGRHEAEALVASYLDDGAPAPHDVVHSMMALDVHTWLVDDVLTKMDRMSMAASVEARVPFLDHRLMEFMATLPVSLKVRTLGTKWLLRRSMRGALPAHTLRRRKQSFWVPVDEWLRGPLRELLADTLLSARVAERGWLDPAAVRRLIEAHVGGRGSHGQRLWNLLCLELWARAFLDGKGAA
jgi:asparagine synthase (glutamine-hydrolysing)